MKLIKPTLQYEESFREGLEEFEAEDAKGFWDIGKKAIDDIKSYIHTSQKYEKGIDLPKNWASASTYWLMDEDEFVGTIIIIQQKKEGGNIGYYIRPSMRQKGYGKKILELSLPKAKELGIKKVLITCDEDNVASRKIIEQNGGIYEGPAELNGIPICRYWIDLVN